MSNRTIAIIVASMIGVAFLGLGLWVSSRSSPPLDTSEASPPPANVEPASSEERPKQTAEATIPAFRVITDTIAYDNPLRSQVEITVFMEDRVTEESIRLLLDHLYELAKKVGPFQYRQHPNCFDIRIYARRGQSYIAQGWKNPSSEFDVQIRKGLLATVNDPPTVRFGLNENNRQMIWRDIVRVEDRAHLEAKELYPFPMPRNDPNYTETGEKNQLEKQLDYARELMKQYRIELAESLGLTMEQLEEIGDEGVVNWWKSPSLP